MGRSFLGFVALVAIVSGCTVPPPKASLISDTPVGAQSFAAAQQAAAVCGRSMPDIQTTKAALQSLGYDVLSETQPDNRSRQQVITLELKPRAVKVLLAERDTVVGARTADTSACIVAGAGMTPQQSYELALPWVRRFGTPTNAENGQGLSSRAIQAWGKITKDRIVNIAANKTHEIDDVPGASARLLITVK